jgi:hypothetical protein
MQLSMSYLDLFISYHFGPKNKNKVCNDIIPYKVNYGRGNIFLLY